VKTLHRTLEEYLAMRRNLGFKLRGEGAYLAKFAFFMESRKTSHITTRLALEWALKTPGRQANKRLTIVREFAKYAAAFDSRTEVPAQNLLFSKTVRPRPYIYSQDEVNRLLEAAWTRHDDQPRGTYYCLFGLLAVSGLRVGEAIGLQVHDVDLTQGILSIRNTKFGKSRLVPVHWSTVKKLREYKERRDALLGMHSSTHFLVTRKGARLEHSRIYQVFKALAVTAGIRKVVSGPGPRLHDFRHRFAVRTLIDWYRSGEDVEARLPVLSTYLGHVSVENTYWYLTEYPELMNLAVQRLNARWEERS
jgi:integrase/recombinase XerD